MTLAPIALFCYRRLNVLIETVEALKKNEESKDSLLFIFSDGSKNDEDKKGVEEVRDYIKTIDGFRKIAIIEAPNNKGLANSIIDGVTRVVNEYGKIIVIEDDILTSPYFLKYMNEALDMYENEENVGSITGYGYNLGNLPATFFMKGGECWSWATWKRAWDLFEPDGLKLLKELKKRHLDREFDFYDSNCLTEMLRYQIVGKNNSWAIRWIASCFLNDKLCLYPAKPIVVNIGFGLEGSTHCSQKADNESVKKIIDKNPVKLSKIDVKENTLCRKLYGEHFKKTAVDPFTKGNFLFKKERLGNKRMVTILGFIKFKYEANDNVSKEIKKRWIKK